MKSNIKKSKITENNKKNFKYHTSKKSIVPERIQWNAAHPYSGGKCSPR